MTFSLEKVARFSLAVVVWAILAFPCQHLAHFYFDPRAFGTTIADHVSAPIESYHRLALNYVWVTIWTTVLVSVVGAIILWLLPDRWSGKENFQYHFPVAGACLGLLLGFVAWRLAWNPFQTIATYFSGPPQARVRGHDFYEFSPDNFVYSGLLAGLVAGEFRRRLAIWRSSAIPGERDLRINFQIAALITWAIILKVLEWQDISFSAPGRNYFGIHFFMFVPVLIWNPILCMFLWRHRPSRLLYSLCFTSLLGVLVPLVVSLAIAYPSGLLMFFGLPWFFFVPWGIRFWTAVGPMKPILLFAPGITWGIVVGWLRWRYLQRQALQSMDTQFP